MESEVVYPKDIKVSKFRYSAMKKTPSGSKMIYINYGDEKLTVQTPLMILPYGVSDGSAIAPKDAGAGAGRREADDIGGGGLKRYDLSISFRGKEDNPKVKVFYDKMVEIEKKIMDDAFNNREAWLGDDYEGMRTIVNKMMNPMIRTDREKKYPPTMKVKLPYDHVIDNFVFDAVDMDGNEIDFKAVMNKLKGTKAILIIQLTGLYFAAGKYGCMWKIKSGMFQKVNTSRKIAFRPDSDVEDNAGRSGAHSDDEDLEEEAAAVAAGGAKKEAPNTVVSDSDDDGPVASSSAAPAAKDEDDDDEDDEEEEIEESSEDEPTPPPPPPPKKKTTATTKKAAK